MVTGAETNEHTDVLGGVVPLFGEPRMVRDEFVDVSVGIWFDTDVGSVASG